MHIILLRILAEETQHFTQCFITWLYVTDGNIYHDNGLTKVYARTRA